VPELSTVITSLSMRLAGTHKQHKYTQRHKHTHKQHEHSLTTL